MAAAAGAVVAVCSARIGGEEAEHLVRSARRRRGGDTLVARTPTGTNRTASAHLHVVMRKGMPGCSAGHLAV